MKVQAKDIFDKACGSGGGDHNRGFVGDVGLDYERGGLASGGVAHGEQQLKHVTPIQKLIIRARVLGFGPEGPSWSQAI